MGPIGGDFVSFGAVWFLPSQEKGLVILREGGGGGGGSVWLLKVLFCC